MSQSVFRCSAIVMILFCGCDFGTYCARYKERLKSMQKLAGTSENLASGGTQIGQVGSVRLPAVVQNNGVVFDAGAEYKKARLPGISIEKFIVSYRGTVNSGGKMLPIQAYFYSMPKPSAITTVKKTIRDAVAKAMPGLQDRWQDQTVEGYDGVSRNVPVMDIITSMPFYVPNADGVELEENMNGRITFYLVNNDSTCLLLVIRAPTAVYDERDGIGTLSSLQGFF